MKTAKAFLALIWSLAYSTGAEPAWEWVQTIGTSTPDGATGIVLDANGTVFVSGYCGPVRAGTFDISGGIFWLRVSNTTGEILGVKAAGPSGGSAYSSALAIAGNGDIISSGRIRGALILDATIYWGNDYQQDELSFLVRLNSQLQKQWAYVYGLAVSLDPGPPAVALDGSIVAATSFRVANYRGVSQGAIGGSEDALVLKTSGNGDLQWLKRGGGTNSDGALAVEVDGDNNVFLGGFSYPATLSFGALTTNVSGPGTGAFVVRWSSDGNAQAIRTFETGGHDIVSAIRALGGGEVIVAGVLNSSINGSPVYRPNGVGFISHLRSDGSSIWTKQLPGIRPVDIRLDRSRNIVFSADITGSTTIDGKSFTSRGDLDVFVGQMSPSGTLNWGITGGGAFEESVGQIAVGPDDAVYVTGEFRVGATFGTTFLDGRGQQDAFYAKITEGTSRLKPTIATQPMGGAAFIGTSFAISVAAQSSRPLTYQWYKDGTPIAGQISSTLVLNSVRASDGALYWVEVRNEYGTIRSESTRLIVPGDLPVFVTTIAGNNVAGFFDATIARNARFNGPDSLAVMGDGVIVIPDAGNNAIRVLEPGGAVGTWAGKGPSFAGLSNGPASSATFNLPIGVCVNPAWDVFVADGYNHVVRKLSGFGARLVSTYAGTGEEGFGNGAAAQAKFAFPNDLVSDNAGNLYVTEFRGHRVRRISTDGIVTTFAGTGEKGHRDGAGSQAMFNEPAGIARDSVGNLYVTCWGSETIRKITPDGVVSTIAGSVGQRGFVDGPALNGARLGAPNGIAVDNKGNIFFTEYVNNSVRRIDPLGDVLTLVGTAGPGFKDGGRAEAQMLHPGGVAVHPDGGLVVADTENHAIRKVIWQTNAAPTEAVVLIELNPSITIFGVPGKTYRVETTESLVSDQWIGLGEVTLVSPVETWFDSQPVTRRHRYYRAVMK